MARNIFASEFAQGNWVPAAQAGIDFANQFDDRIRSRRASTRAAPMIASGDYQGAAGVYGEAGLADDALTLRGQAEGLTRQARADERQAMQDKRQATADERAAAAEVAKVWESTATNLISRIPADPQNPMAAAQQRFEAFTQTPIYRNFTPEQRTQVVVEDFTDDALALVVQEVRDQIERVTFGGDGLTTFNKTRGEYGPIIREPTQKVLKMSADQVAYDEDGNVIARGPPRTRAPGVGRAGASSGGRSLGAQLPEGY
jgi:hypothetical protein